MELKELLFEKTQQEQETYNFLRRNNLALYGLFLQKKRFSSLYDFIEDTGLLNEYCEWKETHPLTKHVKKQMF